MPLAGTLLSLVLLEVISPQTAAGIWMSIAVAWTIVVIVKLWRDA